VITGVVNGGHNDALVALFVIAAVLLASKEKDVLAGAAFGLAASIKIVALLGLGGLVVWTLRARGARAASKIATSAVVLTIAGYLASGGVAATRPLRVARALVSVTSIWDVARHGGFVPWLALASVIALAIIFAWRAQDGTRATTLALGAYLLVGAYILPWYIAWVVPLAALTKERALQIGAVVLGFGLQFVYVRAGAGTGAHLHGFLAGALHLIQVAAIVALIVWGRKAERPHMAGARDGSTS
jgi:hypothetical protein